jgi:hypothetical protein
MMNVNSWWLFTQKYCSWCKWGKKKKKKKSTVSNYINTEGDPNGILFKVVVKPK